MSDDQNEEFVLYAAKASSLLEIQQLQDQEPEGLKLVRIMHSPDLVSMKGLSRFANLNEINLSSNSIEKINGLFNLKNLQVLNLSTNRITQISGLLDLKKLKVLILSHNRISSLKNLEQIHTPEYGLEDLDLSDNRISDVKQLRYISGLINLQTLTIQSGQDSNPVCGNQVEYFEAILSLENIDSLKRIDQHSKSYIQQELISLQENDQENLNTNNNQLKFSKLKALLERSRKQTEGIPIKKQRFSPNRRRKIRDHQKQEQVNINQTLENYQDQMMGLNVQIQKFSQNTQQLEYKLECNDKFWGQKCQDLNENLMKLKEENGGLKKRLGGCLAEIKDLKLDKKNETFQLQNLKRKKERKDEQVENLQDRISTLLKENGEYHRELFKRMEEIEKISGLCGGREQEILQLKAVVKENEKNLQTLHLQAIENSNKNLKRSESGQQKLTKLETKIEDQSKETLLLVDKNRELVGLCKEWESKYSNRLDEVQNEQNNKAQSMNFQHQKQISELESFHLQQTHEKELGFQKNMDLFENEFKKVLLEQNQKYRDLQMAFQDKGKTEGDMKNLIQVTIAKNNEQEDIITELTDALEQVKEQYVSNAKKIQDEYNQLKTALLQSERELKQVSFKNAQLLNEKSSIEEIMQEQGQNFNAKNKNVILLRRENEELTSLISDIKPKYEQLCLQLKRGEDKKKEEITQIEQQIDSLNDLIITKNKMLDDKNDTIEELKQKLKNSEQEIQAIQKDNKLNTVEKQLQNEIEEREELEMKYQDQKEIIQDLELQLSYIKEELQKADEYIKKQQGSIDNKNTALNLIEKEIENVRVRQDQDMEDIQEKTDRILELEEILKQCNESLIEKKNTIQFQANQLQEMDQKLSLILTSKDQEIQHLKGQVFEMEEEMKVLVFEIERQKEEMRKKQEVLKNLFK